MAPMMGLGASLSTAVSERTAVVIEDYMFDSSTAGELTPEVSPSDFHDPWDLDGTDFTPEVSPDDEGYWDDFENVVLNGNYEELGSELVTNGAFDTGSDWTFESSWGVSGGKANYDAVVNQHYLKQTISPSISAGKAIKIQFDISDVEAGKTAFLKLEIDGSPEAVFAYTNFSAGTYTYYYKITSALDRLNFVPATSGTGGAFSIDNVSVKQIDPNDRWTLGTGWSIEDGKAVFSGTDFANLQLSSTILTIGDTYELTLTAAVTNGSFKVQHSGSSDLITESSSGTYSVTFTATATSFTIARATVGSQNDFTIDNLTVKEYAITPLDV
jgi:hypothetical protein